MFTFLYFLVLFQWRPPSIYFITKWYDRSYITLVYLLSNVLSVFVHVYLLFLYFLILFSWRPSIIFMPCTIQTKAQSFLFQAIDMFMSSCTVFVFLSLIEYAFVNVMMGDISEVEQKAKKNHLRNITYQIVLTWMLNTWYCCSCITIWCPRIFCCCCILG